MGKAGKGTGSFGAFPRKPGPLRAKGLKRCTSFRLSLRRPGLCRKEAHQDTYPLPALRQEIIPHTEGSLLVLLIPSQVNEKM